MNKSKEYKQYFTPSKLAKYMINLIPNDEISNIIDLSMGECGLLEEAKKRWDTASFFGADIDETLIGKIKRSSPYIQTYCCDSTSDDIKNWGDYELIINSNKFDLVVANPPFNYFQQTKLNIDGKQIALPIEMVFLKKYISIVRPGGYICIILPYGFLSLDLYKELRIDVLKQVTFIKTIKLFKNCFDKIDADTCLVLMRKKMNNEMMIQNEIELSYLNSDYVETEKMRIKCIDSPIFRLDLEYHKFRKNFTELQKIITYPIYPLSYYVVNCKRGKTITLNKQLIVDKGMRFIHTTNLKPLFISDESMLHVTRNSKYLKSAIIRKDNILIGRVGSACIGKVAIVTKTYPLSVISDCIFSLTVDGIDPYYLTLYLASKYGQFQMIGFAKGSCSKYITKDDICSINIIVPPKTVQKSFGKKYLDILKMPGCRKNKKMRLLQNLLLEFEEFIEGST